MSRLTTSLAMALIEVVFETAPETISTGESGGAVEAYVYGITADQARADVESYLSVTRAPDEDSIQITPDVMEEDRTTPVARIFIKTMGG